MPRTRRERGHYGRHYRNLRATVLVEEQVCYLCGEWVDKTLDWRNPGAPQVHFVVPVTQGGSWRDRRNARLTHARCNVRQGNKWDGTVDHSAGPRQRDDVSWAVIGEEP